MLAQEIECDVRAVGRNEAVTEPLMVSLPVVVIYVFRHDPSPVPRAERRQFPKALHRHLATRSQGPRLA